MWDTMFVKLTFTYVQKQNILRSFIFMKQKYFPDGTKDKLKARHVVDDSQQGRYLYEFVSSALVSLRVVLYYSTLHHTINVWIFAVAFPQRWIHSRDNPIYQKMNKDVVPY